MDRATPSVYVDFAGNAALRRRIHEHFGAALRYSCSVGGTHWDELGGGRDLPGPRPTLFFAPAQIAKRSAAPPAGWGPAELQTRIAAAWTAFMQTGQRPGRAVAARAQRPRAAGRATGLPGAAGRQGRCP